MDKHTGKCLLSLVLSFTVGLAALIMFDQDIKAMSLKTVRKTEVTTKIEVKPIKVSLVPEPKETVKVQKQVQSNGCYSHCHTRCHTRGYRCGRPLLNTAIFAGRVVSAPFRFVFCRW